MPFSNAQLSNIPRVISQPRFATYLQSCHNDRVKALELYQWNLRISSAFIVPLHILEVSIRNAVVEALEAVHTSNWPWNQGFIVSLPNPSNGYSARKNLQRVASRQITMGKVVAELNFVFWEKMFTSRHDSRIWHTYIKSVFPYVPATMSIQQVRSDIHNKMRDIRDLRNRIAHHEPIFSRNIQSNYDDMYNLIRWRDNVTAVWVNDMQRVTQMIGERPVI